MSSKARRQSGHVRKVSEVQSRLPWQPLEQLELNPVYLAMSVGGKMPLAAWGNDIYQIVVYQFERTEDGAEPMLHLSIKRHDRLPIHDWRHLQAIKNEIAGPERVALEVYPPESQLVDTANQYHLWVMPTDVELPFGFSEQFISSDAQVEMFNEARERGQHKGRQRPFQPNLPVAEGRNDQPGADEDIDAVHAGFTQTIKAIR